MKREFRCPKCAAAKTLEDREIPPEGTRVQCEACGASFSLRRSAKPAPAAGRPAASAEPAAEPSVVCPRCGLHFAPDARRAPRPEGARPVVLILEDMDYFLEIARDVLSEKYELRTGSTVADGLREISRGGLDLLLVDLNLAGGEDGRDLLRALPDKRFPILAITAQDESEIPGERWDELRSLGVDDLVRKGMHMGEVLARKVAEHLGEGPPDDPARP